jgi:hypothetical protein
MKPVLSRGLSTPPFKDFLIDGFGPAWFSISPLGIRLAAEQNDPASKNRKALNNTLFNFTSPAL